MDGNGRWAESRGLMRLMGHRSGVKTVKKIVSAASDLKLEALTLYAFSTENWKRPDQEVSGLMNLLKTFLEQELATMLANNIKLRCMGDIARMPTEVYQVLSKAMAATANNTGLVLNLALNYGSRDEILKATRELASLCLDGSLKPEDINEELLSHHLYSQNLPDPDLIIRTGGEYRLSNFLLWQASYAEIYITETNWPDFTVDDLHQAIDSYQQRQRRFGRTGKQVDNNSNHK